MSRSLVCVCVCWGGTQTQTMGEKKIEIEAHFEKLRSFVNTFRRARRGRTKEGMKSRAVGGTSAVKLCDIRGAKCLSAKK